MSLVFLFNYRTQSISDMAHMSRENIVSYTILSSHTPQAYTNTYLSKNTVEIKKITHLLSTVDVHLEGKSKIKSNDPPYSSNDVAYKIIYNCKSVDKGNYELSFTYHDGFIYYKNCKYKIESSKLKYFLSNIRYYCKN